MNIRLRALLIASIITAAFAAALSPAIAEEPNAEKSGDADSGSGWSAQVAPEDQAGVTLGPEQTALVEQINGYFSNLTTLQGRFVQTNADKKKMKGKFKMLRPGKFRFDYARPSLQVIISDGEYLAIQDHDLGNEDRIELNQTPFRVLLRKDVDLLRDADIVAVKETDETIYLALRDKSPDASGVIRLTFTKTPKLELSSWITTDAQGLDTHVLVGNLVYGEKIDAKEFVIKAPERRLIQ